MSDIVLHPLTAVNGSPQYTADDYRHVINPFMFPSDGTPFNCVQGVREGSPSPLCAISGLTVTVRPHCGVVCPWSGVGAYTYAITEAMSVSVPDSTGDYKIVVVASDASLSHGASSDATLQSLPAGVPDAEIDGLVLARVTAGVISDVAPRLRSDGVIEVPKLPQLDAIRTVEGVEAVVRSTGGRYRRLDDAWVPLTDIKLNPGVWAKDWTIEYKCSMCGNVVSLYVKATRGPEWVAQAWMKSQILTFPDYVKPKVIDLNVPAAGVANSGFQLDSSGLYVRPFANITYAQGSWTSVTLTYSV